MKKKIIVLTGIILFILVLVITILVLNSSSKTLEHTYTTNGGVPYYWEYEIEDKSIVEFVKDYVVEDKNKGGLVGAPISTNYVFKGLKKGKTKITFKYVSVVDGTVAKEEVTKVLVDKNKNISLYMESK